MKTFIASLLMFAFAQGLFAQDINSLSRDERRELITSFINQDPMQDEYLPTQYAFYDVDKDGRMELFLRNSAQTVAYVHPKRSGWNELCRADGNSQMEVADGLVAVDGMAGYRFHYKQWVALQDGIVMSEISLEETQNEETGDFVPQRMTYFGEEQSDYKPRLEMIAEYPDTTPVYDLFNWLPFPRQ